MEMRVMQTARAGGDASLRVDSQGAARPAESGVGAGAGVDGGMPAIMGDAREHWLGRVVFRE